MDIEGFIINCYVYVIRETKNEAHANFVRTLQNTLKFIKT